MRSLKWEGVLGGRKWRAASYIPDFCFPNCRLTNGALRSCAFCAHVQSGRMPFVRMCNELAEPLPPLAIFNSLYREELQVVVFYLQSCLNWTQVIVRQWAKSLSWVGYQLQSPRSCVVVMFIVFVTGSVLLMNSQHVFLCLVADSVSTLSCKPHKKPNNFCPAGTQYNEIFLFSMSATSLGPIILPRV